MERRWDLGPSSPCAGGKNVVQSKQKCQRPGAVPGGKGACPWESDWACARRGSPGTRGKTSAWRKRPFDRRQTRGPTWPCCRRCSTAPTKTPASPSTGSPPGGRPGSSWPPWPGSWGCTWPGALCRSWRGTRCTTPATSSPPKGRSWPATGRSTSSTSTCRGASGSRSQTPWPPATRSRWWTPPWARWALPSALTFASPNSSGSWGTGGPSSSWCLPPST